MGHQLEGQAFEIEAAALLRQSERAIRVALLPESLRALPHPGVVFRPLADPPVADLYLAWRGTPEPVAQ